MEKQEQTVPKTISLSTEKGFLMFLEDMTQEYVDSIETTDELSVVALLLWTRMGMYEEKEDYKVCSIIKEKMGMINIKGKKLLKV